MHDGGSWSAGDFDVVLVDSGETVGRTVRGPAQAWASLIGRASPSSHAQCAPPLCGLPESKDVAKRAFAARCFATGAPTLALCYRSGMFSIIDRVLEAKGAGWSFLRFALILTPAVIALVVLSTAFRLE
jgi:hypothetical protein